MLFGVQVVEHAGLEDEEAGVDQPVDLRLLAEPLDAALAVDLHDAEPRSGRTVVTVASLPWPR